jgi:hypothetical protein
LSVLVAMVCIKGASRPFGIEQVRPLTHTTTTRERRSYPGAAEKYGNKRKASWPPRPGAPAMRPGDGTVGLDDWATTHPR